MFTCAVWFFVAFLVIIILDWIRIKLRYKKYLVNIPGPTSLPLFGCLFEFDSIEDSLYIGERIMNMYGPIVKGNVAFLEFLLICDKKWVEFILNSPKTLKKSFVYEMLEKWLGKGLLTSSGIKWHKDRKFLTPTFHFNRISQYVDTFNKSSAILVEKLANEVGKQTIEIESFVTLCSLDIICDSIMGISMKAQMNETNEYVRSVDVMKNLIYRRTISIWKSIDLLYIFSKDYWKEKKALKILHSTTDSVIKERRNFLLKDQKSDSDLEQSKEPLTFLDILLKGRIDGVPLNDAEIREQVDTFMFEGHDTTSSAISFALYCLSKNAQVQEKALEELKFILGDDVSTSPTYQNFKDMKYLNLIIKETLRMFPSVPVIARTLEEDLEFEGTLLPKGLNILIGNINFHEYYKNKESPFIFYPERFSDENMIGKHPYTYIPFSAGFRNCIGQKFAVLEMKAVLSKLLRHYKILPVEEFLPNMKADIVLKAKNGIHIRLERRT